MVAFFAVGLLFLGACTEELNDDFFLSKDIDSLSALKTDTISVQLFPYTVDSVLSSNVPSSLVGVYNDPVFGTTTTSFATQFLPMYIETIEGEILFLDSVVLSLYYDSLPGSAYGKILTSQQINVYELEKAIYSDSSYYSNMDINELHSGKLLGSTSYTPDNGNDTLLSLHLNNELGQRLIDNLDLLSSSVTFRDLFKGIVVTPDASVSDAAVVRFLTTSPYSSLKVWYHTTTEDSLNLHFAISTSPKINLFGHDYSTTSFYNNLNRDDLPQLENSYLQGAAGLSTRIKFPYLQEFTQDGLIGILKAELVVKAEDYTIAGEDNFPIIDNLKMLAKNTEGEFYYLEDFLTSSTYLTSPFDAINREYRFNISYYVEGLLNDRNPDYELFLLPNSSNTEVNRSVIGSGVHPSQKVQLVLTYTKL